MKMNNIKRNKLTKWVSIAAVVSLLIASAPVPADKISVPQVADTNGASYASKENRKITKDANSYLKTNSSAKVNPDFITEKPAQESLNNRIIVKLSEGTDPEKVAQIIGAKVVRKGPLHFATLELEPEGNGGYTGMDRYTVEEKLQNIPGVISVKKPHLLRTTSAGSPEKLQTAGVTVSDPNYREQWALTKIEAPKAWDLGATGQGVTIAIVDTGVDLEHPDLKANIVPGYNAITGSESPRAAQDNNGHGTHVAGIAAASLNGLGIVGVAYQAKIMPIKAMDRYGEGTDDVIADGIVWAVDHGADIINLSLGSDVQENILTEAIQYAVEKGCLVVAAAGNIEGNTNTKITYPAADPNVIAVTATDHNDQVASFSKTGPEAVLAAPGVNILSDFWSKGQSGLASAEGTSMAAPFVAGVAALVWSEHPDWTAGQVRAVLENSALDLGEAGRDNFYGYGRVDAYWAVKFAQDPAEYVSPASVNWAGGIVKGRSGSTSVTLSLPPRPFGLNPQKSVNVTIDAVNSPGDFPPGILPGGEAFSVKWAETARKMFTLAFSTTVPTGSDRIGYIYRWSGSRWLQVGGGVAATTVSAGIMEPGIYRLGYAPMPGYTRLAGTDRIQTAILISQAAFPTGADTVILARADDFPDALAGAPLAYKLHAPILLTEVNSLPAEVLSEMKRLAPSKIIILGGPGAVSQAIATELQSLATVERISGANRYATAAGIAQALGTVGEAVVVNGENFPDAISIASAAAQYGLPILLTSANTLEPDTDNTLRKLLVSDTLVVGGKGVISAKTFAKLPGALRLYGNDRYETAVSVLKAIPAQGNLVFVATGENFPDALTGGVLAATNGTNIVLVPPSGPTAQELTVLLSWRGKKAVALGGSGVISNDIINRIQANMK